jgi:hypothetical protein
MTTAQKPDALPDDLRLLAASMHHSAGQWMVPGWDGHKVAALLEKAQASLLAKEAECEALRDGSVLAAAYERDYEKAVKEAKRWAEFIPEIQGNYSAESVIALLGNLVTDLRAGEAKDEALLRRCLAQMGQWQSKYGEHNPSWLPPAGDVKLAEDIDAARAAADQGGAS